MDTNQTPQVPDFTPPTVATGNSVPTTSVVPPFSGAPVNKRKRFGLILAILIAVAIPVVSYFVYTNSQTVNTEAAPITSCRELPIGSSCADHRWSDRNCYDRGNPVMVQCRDGSRYCVPDGETFQACGDGCKRINPCQLKCRNSQGLEQFVNTCESQATPTPQKTELCEEPFQCVDPSTAAQTGCISAAASAPMPASCSKPGTIDSGFCCKPKITNTPVPSMTPTMTPTPTPTITVTPSPTPAQCVNPKIDVEVQCLTCGTQ
jgi:hypothetical protein